MKKVLLSVMVLLVAISLMASDLYKEGFRKGYQDGVMKVVYFVAPTMGKPTDWVKGYKEGYQKGLKVKLDGNVQLPVVNNSNDYKIKKELEDVLSLYGAVSVASDETAYELYKDSS